MNRRFDWFLGCLIAVLIFGSCARKTEMVREADFAETEKPKSLAEGKRLINRHIDQETFLHTIYNARNYEAEGLVEAGVIPHHVTGGALISGFFKLAAENADRYDTVIIVSPNHAGDVADIIVSGRDWDAFGEVLCDTGLITSVLDLQIPNAKIVENSQRMEEDHSASVLVPYIRHYLPNAKVAPILVSRTLTLDATTEFASALSDIIAAADQNVLLICSVDFSHYLSPKDAAQNDLIMRNAILTKDYKQIHDFGNTFVDSPASLIVFLQYIDRLEMEPRIMENTDASEFLGAMLPETTTYFVILGETEK